ncbi:MAG: cytochrome c, partial [Cyclobacteriaceae bacterium]|nr:cytochrome c [Cyclobacteriaceae bacterium]
MGITLFLASCAAGPDDTGVEYAQQMYHSIAYEGLSQIQDPEAGRWLTSTEEETHAEFYNSNPYNSFAMTMREPVAGTVKRGQYL